MNLLCIFLVVFFCPSTCAQSGVQQCLTEQIRNLNSNAQKQEYVTPENTTIAAFDSICRNYEDYMNCFQARLQPSDHPADRFLQLIFSKPDMERAYRGLCTLDLETLRSNIACVLSTPEARRCYSSFNQGINKVVTLQTENHLSKSTVEELACNVSVTRYQCETNVYALCNSRIGHIMQDFFFAGLPDTCRTSAGVRSRYVNIFNGGNAPLSRANVVVTLLLLVLYKQI